MPESIVKHAMHLHQGRALQIVADTYGTLLLTIIEQIQNGIDADGTQIVAIIDLMSSTSYVADNGTGTTLADFMDALTTVGETRKSGDRLGRFGRGLISPIGKCKSFTFTSTPNEALIRLASERHTFSANDRNATHRWCFDCASIREQKYEITIPYQQLGTMAAIPRQFQPALKGFGLEQQQWATIVQMQGISDDRVIRAINLDELESQIRVKLMERMRKQGTTVHVVLNDDRGVLTSCVIEPTSTHGEALPVVEYNDADCGVVRFELFKAPKTRDGRKGVVRVKKLGDNTAISWQEYSVQALGKKYLEAFKKAFEVLGSGYFEGVISIERIELHAERRKFLSSVALEASYYVIDTWYEQHGKSHFKEAHESQLEERHMKLGQEALESLLVKLAESPTLHSVLDRLVGNAPDVEMPSDDEQSSPAKKPDKQQPKPRSKRREPRRRSPDVEGSHLPKPDLPEASDVPNPENRKAPVTLRFAYEMLSGSEQLWYYDHDTVTIVFNTIHPAWIKLDETNGKHTSRHDRQIVALQRWVGLEVIMLLFASSDPDDFEDTRYYIDERVDLYADVIFDNAS